MARSRSPSRSMSSTRVATTPSAAVTPDSGLDAGALVVDAAKTIGGGGRSNPEVTMVGGKAPEHLADALEQARAAAHAG